MEQLQPAAHVVQEYAQECCCRDNLVKQLEYDIDLRDCTLKQLTAAQLVQQLQHDLCQKDTVAADRRVGRAATVL